MSAAPEGVSALSPERLAAAAVGALVAEAELTPKPGLIDRRGRGAHDDMDLNLLVRSARALEPALIACAAAATVHPPGPTLRITLGRIGRDGEARMLAVTGGVNTHRGALWTLGLLCAGIGASSGQASLAAIIGVAARLARTPDPALPTDATASHGARMRRLHGCGGAVEQARAGFPAVVEAGLPVLRGARERGAGETTARLDALLAVIAILDDTCLLHRGGRAGLAAMRDAASAVLKAGGTATPAGQLRLWAMDALAQRYRLSPGGSGDLLAATLLLDAVDRRSLSC